eukprot:COSAG01_NODE_7875_length_3019_cov_5.998627_3_plen_68_part_00
MRAQVVPAQYTASQPCAGMPNEARRTYCGMVRLVDECVETSLTQMLEMIDPGTMFVLMADNVRADVH